MIPHISLHRRSTHLHNLPQVTDLPITINSLLFKLGRPSPSSALPYASFHHICKKYWNINQFPIDYALQPRLRGRLTLGRLTLPMETLGFRRRGISPLFSLLMPAFSLLIPPATLTSHLQRPTECSPTPSSKLLSRIFGTMLSPVILSVHDNSTSELLRTL